MNIKTLKTLFILFNANLFDGRIPICEIVLKKLPKKENLGSFNFGVKTYPRIVLDSELHDLTMLEVLLHEMCHAYVFAVYPKIEKEHGSKFKKIYKQIFGLPYNIDHRTTPFWLMNIFSNLHINLVLPKEDLKVINKMEVDFDKNLKLAKAKWKKRSKQS